MRTLFLTIISSLFIVSSVKGQLTTTQTLTPQQLVQNVLLGTGVTASNITYTGDPLQIAQFVATSSSNLGIPSGVFISAGHASTSSPNGPQGPNNSGSTGTDWNGAGDILLDGISGVNTFDAAVLEFDFIPTGDSVKFRYCFGSEEYPEFVNAGVNDAFAFFLSGPNPAGGNYVNKNVALLPGTTTAVSIDNVNAGLNSSYYRSNSTNTINCEFDGFTTVLYALEKIICGQTYHIKIAIADGGDGIYDSGVFLEGGSFSSLPPITVSSSNSNASFTDSVIVEDCNTNCVYFIRNGSLAQKDSFNLQVNGNAILGSDYVQTGNPSFAWPTKLIFSPNQDTIKICNLFALQDNITETTDTIQFTITTYSVSGPQSCASSTAIKFKLFVRDYEPIQIGQNDSIICNGQGIVLNANASLGVSPYTYTWAPSNNHLASENIPLITQTTTYTIQVNDICNKIVTKEITITPSTLPKISNIGPYRFCLDSVKKIPIEVIGGKPSFTINWQVPSSGFIAYDTLNNVYYFKQSLTPSSGTYTIAISDQCNNKDTITVEIATVDCNIIVPNVVTPNGDNVNEYFKIAGIDNFPGSALDVFNRWGRKVYSSNDYKNDWKPDVNDGTYFYIINITDGRKFNGFFQVFKN